MLRSTFTRRLILGSLLVAIASAVAKDSSRKLDIRTLTFF